ncbi:MAG TPA: carboxypeptidase regulatory-like domain-containing protein [Bryobacteraceae bacterium]|nr:carboxypeptidase regulatory-like domain-containing protein [Bryobacteraceae bacterium]
MVRAVTLAALVASAALAQNASLVGTVRDPQDAVVPNANITLTNTQTKVVQSTQTDGGGNFEFSVVRPGSYSLRVEGSGFRTYEQQDLTLAVDQRERADVVLQVGDASSMVTVAAEAGTVNTESANLGEVIETKKIVEIPLNGRFFLDLALLTPGTVVPSTNNRTFLASPSGIGASGINASGAREDSTNYLFDGINLSDMVQNQITFQPNIDMIQEFKVQTNAFSAEYGRNAGIIINAVSKAGTNSFHGTAYEFVRNDKFDAKNYFDRGDAPIPPFKRNIYGYAIGGPVIRNKTFFFHSYEGRQGRESVSLRTPVPSDAQRAAVTNPVVRNLLTLVPSANSPDGFFVGSVPKKRTLNQFSGRIDHNLSTNNLLAGTFIINRDERTEPTLQNNNLPGSGDSRPAKRYFVALTWTSVVSSNITNELRAGLNRVRIDFSPDATQNPADFGMTTNSPILPRFVVTGGMAFGGIVGFPQGRGDTTFQYTDTLSVFRGRHSMKFGAEFRRFRNNNFNGGTGGTITFPNLAAFLAGTPTTTTQQTLAASPGLRVNALNFFAQDDFKVNSRLTLNLGLRYEYNGVPSEIHDRLSVYDFTTQTLKPIGMGADRPYSRQFTAFGPRLGIVVDPFGKQKTVVRAGVGLYYDQPVTNLVSPLGSNPPFVGSVTFNSTPQLPLNIDLRAPYSLPGGGPAILNVNAVDPNFRAGQVLQYNFNVQHDAFNTLFQVGYVGSQGRRLRLLRDVNQGINSVRPVAAWGVINLNESSSRSNYNALWISANKRFSKGLTFTTSYTFAKSIDLNSVGSSNPQIQDAYNVSAERALSDFDARHRYVASAFYLLPFRAPGAWSRLVEGWSLAPIVNLQSGNPFSPIVTLLNSGSLQQFDRPNLVPGQPLYVENKSASQWINRAAFTANQRGQFGNAGRNILKAPGFASVDFSIAKNTVIKENYAVQFRAEAFNLFNHPNLGQPVNVVNSAQFGQITSTRTVRGDLGSSRQIQLGIKFLF